MDAKKPHLFVQIGQLYETYSPSLIYYARKFTPPAVAEDIVHDLFLKMWEKEVLLFKETISSYLFRAVRNACLNYLEHQLVHQEYLSKAWTELKIEELHSTLPDEKLINQEELDILYSYIEQLPDKCREVFRMSYVEEKKSAEIADSLHISIRTVEAHLYKALTLLRQLISP